MDAPKTLGLHVRLAKAYLPSDAQRYEILDRAKYLYKEDGMIEELTEKLGG